MEGKNRLLVIAEKQLNELELDTNVLSLLANDELGICFSGREMCLIEAYKDIKRRIKQLKELEDVN